MVGSLNTLNTALIGYLVNRTFGIATTPAFSKSFVHTISKVSIYSNTNISFIKAWKKVHVCTVLYGFWVKGHSLKGNKLVNQYMTELVVTSHDYKTKTSVVQSSCHYVHKKPKQLPKGNKTSVPVTYNTKYQLELFWL